VPKRAVDARHRLDSKLSGANPIDALVEIPKGQSLYSPETLATIAEVQSILESQAGIGKVWSLETLRRWLAKAALPTFDSHGVNRNPIGGRDWDV